MGNTQKHWSVISLRHRSFFLFLIEKFFIRYILIAVSPLPTPFRSSQIHTLFAFSHETNVCHLLHSLSLTYARCFNSCGEWVGDEWMCKPSSSMLWTELHLIQSWPFLHFPPNSLFLEYVKFVCWSWWGNLPCVYLCFHFCLFVEIGVHYVYVAPGGPWTRSSFCISLQGTGTKGMHHYACDFI